LGEEEEGGVVHALVAELLDVEEAAAGADVALAEVLDSVNDGRPAGAGDPVVVRLAHAPDRGDVVLEQVVLSEVWRSVGQLVGSRSTGRKGGGVGA